MTILREESDFEFIKNWIIRLSAFVKCTDCGLKLALQLHFVIGFIKNLSYVWEKLISIIHWRNYYLLSPFFKTMKSQIEIQSNDEFKVTTTYRDLKQDLFLKLDKSFETLFFTIETPFGTEVIKLIS